MISSIPTSSPRILILSNRYPPYYTGGYEIACHSVTERMRSRGYEILVLTSNYGLKRTRIDSTAYRLLHRPQETSSLLQLAQWEIADNRTLGSVIRSWKPDVIYAWSLLQLFPSLSSTIAEAGVPVVTNIQDSWLPTYVAEGDRLREYWLKSGTNRLKDAAKSLIRNGIQKIYPNWLRPIKISDFSLDQVVFCSKFRQRQHQELGLPLGGSSVIYNGVDTDVFTGNPSRPVPGSLRLLFVGRLVAEKGAHTVIQAVAELSRRKIKKITLTIAGVPSYPWEYTKYLIDLVENYNLSDRVQFMNNVPNHLLPDLYRDHDVLVFPSICDEGFPVTIIEAMACGVTVVSTTTGGSAEILVGDENCLTFPSDDPYALADSLEILCDNTRLATCLATKGQSYVRQYLNIEKITDQTLLYLENTC